MAMAGDPQLMRAILAQAVTEILHIDPAVLMMSPRHATAAGPVGCIIISFEQLLDLAEKLFSLSFSFATGALAMGGGGMHQRRRALLSEAIEELLQATRAEGGEKTTVQWYRKRLTRFLKSVGDRDIGTIEAANIRAFLLSLYEAGHLSEDYIEGFDRAIRRLFNWCEAEDLVEKNPMRRIKTRRQGDPPIRFALWSDVERLLETTAPGALDDLRDRAIMFVLYDTGCRVGALCALCCEDVDLENRLIRLNEKKTRKVYARPISQPVAEALRVWLEARPSPPAGALFISLATNTKGQPLTTTGVAQMLKRRARQVGCTGPVHPHSFRHAFARDYLLSGGDIATLCELMGHSSILVTKKYYARFELKELQEKHERYSPVAWRLRCAGEKSDLGMHARPAMQPAHPENRV